LKIDQKLADKLFLDSFFPSNKETQRQNTKIQIPGDNPIKEILTKKTKLARSFLKGHVVIQD